MEGRSGGIFITRLMFFIIISVLLLVSYVWAKNIEIIPNFPSFLIFFGITWIFILAFVIFEKLVQI